MDGSEVDQVGSTAAVAIVGGRVVPVEGDPIDGGVVLIEDGRIAAVGPDVDVPDGASTVAADGKWVLPGFIDAHTHLTGEDTADW